MWRAILFLGFLIQAGSAGSFSVSSTNDTGAGSFRAALGGAGVSPDSADIINFTIPAQTILPISISALGTSIYPSVGKSAGYYLIINPPASLTIDSSGLHTLLPTFLFFNDTGITPNPIFSLTNNMIMNGILSLGANTTMTGSLTLSDGSLYTSSGTIVSSTLLISPTPLTPGGLSGGTIAVDAGTTILEMLVGGGRLTVAGPGIVDLRNVTNVMTGGLSIASGRVLVSEDSQLGQSRGNSVFFSGGVLDTSSGIDTTANELVGTASRIFNLQGPGSIAVNANATTVLGSLVGGGRLTAIGPGIIDLRNVTNVMTGGLSVASGRVLVSEDSQLGQSRGNSVFFSGGVLDTSSGIDTTANELVGTASRIFNLQGSGSIAVNANATTVLGSLVGAGRLSLIGPGIIDLRSISINNSSGGINLTGGILMVSDDVQLGSSAANALFFNGGILQTTIGFTSARAVTMTGNGTVTVNPGQITTLTGALSGGGALTKAGTGILSIQGTTLHTGSTLLSAGTLDLSPTAALTYGGVISGEGNLSIGANTVTLTGINTYGGGTTLAGGVLQVSANNQLGNLTGIPAGLTFTGGTLQTTTGFASARAVTMTGNGTVTVNPGQTTTLTGALSGSSALTKAGTGILSIQGTTLHTGSTLLSAGTFDLSPAADLTYGGAITGAGALSIGVTNPTAHTVTLTGLTGTNTYTGNMSVGAGAALNLSPTAALTYGGIISGAGNLAIGGGQLITLRGVNTYTGSTSIQATTLTLSPTAALTYGGVISGTGNLVVGGDYIVTLTGLNTYTGSTAVLGSSSAGLQLAPASNMIFASTIGGNRLLYIGSAGGPQSTITLSSNTNSYTGGIRVLAGTLQGTTGSIRGNIDLSNGNANVKFSQDTNGTYSGSVSGGGSFMVSGAGIVTLTGNNGYSGTTTIGNGTNGAVSIGAGGNLGSQGTITLNAGTLIPTANLAITPSLTLATGGGGTFNFFNNSATPIIATLRGCFTNTVNGNTQTGSLRTTNPGTGTAILDLNPGSLLGGTSQLPAGNIAIGANTTVNVALFENASYGGIISGSGTFSLGGGVAANPTLTLTGLNTYTGNTSIGASATLNLSPTAALSYGGIISGAGNLAVGGGYTVTLAGVNTYAGSTTVGGNATLAVSNDNQLGALGNLIFNSGTLQTTSGITSARAISLAGNGAINAANVMSTFSGNISSTATSGTTTLSVTGGPVNLNGVISGSRTALSVTGSTVVLGSTAANTYSSGTNIGVGGIVQIGAANQLGSGVMTFAGGRLQPTATLTVTQAINLAAGGGTVNVATAGQTTTLSGGFTGSGSLIADGLGILSLTGATLPTGNIAITNAALNLSPSTNNLTYAGNISGGGALTIGNTPGFTNTIALSGANTYAGGTNILGGNLKGSIASIKGPISIAANAGLEFAQATDGIYASTISGSGTFTKSGEGKLTLTQANAYTGNTILNSGTLSVSASNQLGANTSSLILNGGVLEALDNFTIIQNVSVTADTQINVADGLTLILSSLKGTGNLTKVGSGILAILNIPTIDGYSGIIDIQGGRLRLAQTTGGSYAYRGNIRGIGDVTIDMGGETVTLSGINTYTGATSVSSGTVSVSAGNQLGSGVIGLANSSTLQTTAGITETQNITLGAGGGTIDATNVTSTFSGIISDAVAGAGPLSIAGSKVILQNIANSYSGGTSVGVGSTLQINANRQIGIAGINLGGTLQASNNALSPLVFNLSQVIALATTGGIIDVEAIGAALTLSAITGTGPLTKSGLGDLDLTLLDANPANSITVTAGSVSINSAAQMGAGSLSIAGMLQAQHASGVLTLSQAFGMTAASTIQVTNSAATVAVTSITGSFALTKSGFGDLDLTTILDTNPVSSINIVEGSVSINSAAQLGTGPLSVAATLQVQHTSGVLTLAQSFGMTAASTIKVTNAAATVAVPSITGAFALTKSGDGNLDLTNANANQASSMSLTEGALLINSAAQLGEGPLSIAGTLQAQHTSGVLTLAQSFGMTAASTIQVTNAAATVALSSITGNFGLTKSGLGTLDLANAGINPASSIAVTAGSVFINSATQIGTGSLSIAGTLQAQHPSGVLALSQAFGMTAASTIQVTNAVATVAVPNITGSFALTKSGLGTLDLTNVGINPASSINIAEGSVSINSAAQLGTGPLSLAGTLQAQHASGVLTLSQALGMTAASTIKVTNVGATVAVSSITGSFALTKSGLGDLALTTILDTNPASSITITGGSVSINMVAQLGVGPFSIAGTLQAQHTSGVLTLSQSFGMTAASTIQVTNSAATVAVSNITGGFSLIKAGSGVLDLTNASANQASSMSITEGALLINSAAQLGEGPLSIAGTLQTQHTSGVLTLAQSFGMTAASTIKVTNAAATVAVSSITGAFALTKSGDGNLDLTNANANQASSMSITEGALLINSAAQLGEGPLSIAGTLQAQHTSGVLTLSQAFGMTAASTIQVTNAAATVAVSIITGNFGLTKSGLGTLDLTNAGTNQASSITVTAGSVSINSATQMGTGSLSIAGTLQAQHPSSVLTLSQAFGMTAASTIQVTNAAATVAVSSITGNFGLTKSGLGTLDLTNAGTNQASSTTVTEGSVSINSAEQMGTGSLSIAGTLQAQHVSGVLTLSQAFGMTAASTIQVTNAAAAVAVSSITGSFSLTKSGLGDLDLTILDANPASSITVTAGSVSINSAAQMGAGSLSIAGMLQAQHASGVLTLSQAFGMTAASTIQVTNAAAAVAVSSITGAFALTKSGDGNLDLTNANANQASSVNVIAGSLFINSAAQLGEGPLSIAGTLQTQHTSGVITLAQSFGMTAASTIQVTNAAATVAVPNISGAFALTKSGNGNLDLTNVSDNQANDFTIVGGVVSVNNSGQLGSGTVALANNSALKVTVSITVPQAITLGANGGAIDATGVTSTLSGVISDAVAGAGPLSITGGTVALQNIANTYSGGTSVGANSTVQISDGGQLGTGAITLIDSTMQAIAAASDGSLSLAQDINLQGTGGTIAAPMVTDTVMLSGLLSGNTLTVTGLGTVMPTAINNNYNRTVIDGATVAVSADGQLGAAGGSVTLKNGGTWKTTNTLLSARPLTLGTEGGTIHVANSRTTLSGSISGTGAFRKRGEGILDLAGESIYTGTTTVSEGGLLVSGSLKSPIVVTAGGLLGGAGSLIGSVDVFAGGKLSPGNSSPGNLSSGDSASVISPEILNIDGNLTIHDASAIYACDVNPTGSDHVVVTGSATVNGIVQVIPANGTYTLNKIYTILTAATSLNGSFSAVTAPTGYAFQQMADTTAKTIKLILTAAPSVTPTPTPTPDTSGGTVQEVTNLSGALADMMPTAIQSDSNAKIQADEDSFHFNPVIFAPTRSLPLRQRSALRAATGGQTLHSTFQLLSQQGPLILERDEKRLWVAPYYVYSQSDISATSKVIDRNEGVLMGFDWRSPQFIIGITAGGGFGKQTSPSATPQPNTIDTKSLILGLYHSLMFFENGRYDLVINGVSNRHRSRRFDKPASGAYRADADFKSFSVSGNLSTSWRFRLPEEFSIRPNLGIAVGRNRRSPFSERNANSFNQRYTESKTLSFEPYVGIGLRRKWTTDTHEIKVTGIIEQGYEVSSSSNQTRVFTATGPINGAAVTSLEPGKRATYLTVYGSVLNNTSNLKYILGYSATLQKRRTSHAFTLKGEYRF